MALHSQSDIRSVPGSEAQCIAIVKSAVVACERADPDWLAGLDVQIVVTFDADRIYQSRASQSIWPPRGWSGSAPRQPAFGLYGSDEQILVCLPQLLALLTSDDESERAAALLLVHSELNKLILARSGGALTIRAAQRNAIDEELARVACALFFEYVARRRVWAIDTNAPYFDFRSVALCAHQARQDIRSAARSYRASGDFVRTVQRVGSAGENFVRYCARAIASLTMAGTSLEQEAAEVHAMLGRSNILAEWRMWTGSLSAVYDGARTMIETVSELKGSLERCLSCSGMRVHRSGDGTVALIV